MYKRISCNWCSAEHHAEQPLWAAHNKYWDFLSEKQVVARVHLIYFVSWIDGRKIARKAEIGTLLLNFNVIETTLEKIPFYQRRLMLATLGLWVIGLVALMIRVRIAKAV